MIRNRTLAAAVGVAVFACAAIPITSSAKTIRACNEEWKAGKEAIQASGKKKSEFMIECRAQTASATSTPVEPSPSPNRETTPQANRETAAPASPTPPVTPAPERQRRATLTPPASKNTLGKPGQYTSEADAKAHCAGDRVVWANTHSNIYHYPGNRDYGNTKAGAFMCEHETASAGIRAAKNEKRPE